MQEARTRRHQFWRRACRGVVLLLLAVVPGMQSAAARGQENLAGGIIGVYNRGVAYLNEKRYAEAVEALGQVIAAEKTVRDRSMVRDAYYGRAVAYLAMTPPRYAAAADDATRALALQAGEPETLITRADAYFGLARWEKAAADYKAYLACEGMSGDIYALTRLAEVCAHSGDDKNATDIREVLALVPRDGAATLKARGQLHLRLKNPGAAIADLTQCLTLHPDEGTAYLARGTAYEEKGEFVRAAEDYEKAGERNPRDFAAAFHGGRMHLKIAQPLAATAPEKAVDLCRRAVAALDRAVAHAASASKLDRREIARAIFNQAVACETLASLTNDTPFYRKAAEGFTRYLQFTPSAPDAPAVRERIRLLKERINP